MLILSGNLAPTRGYPEAMASPEPVCVGSSEEAALLWGSMIVTPAYCSTAIDASQAGWPARSCLANDAATVGVREPSVAQGVVRE